MSTLDITEDPYNAKGDGVTDDTNAIQHAFDEAGNGDTVYIPATSDFYRVTKQNTEIRDTALELRARHADISFTIEGDGVDSEIRFDNSNDRANIIHIAVADADPGVYDIDFKNLVINGDGTAKYCAWVDYGSDGYYPGHDIKFTDIRFKNAERALTVVFGEADDGVTTITGKRIDAINMSSHAFALYSGQPYSNISGPTDIKNSLTSVYCENTGNSSTGRHTFNISGSWVLEDIYSTKGNRTNKISNDAVYLYLKNATFTNYDWVDPDKSEGIWWTSIGDSSGPNSIGEDYTFEFDTVAVRDFPDDGPAGFSNSPSDDYSYTGTFKASGPVEFDNINNYCISTDRANTTTDDYDTVYLKNVPDGYYEALNSFDSGEGVADTVEYENVNRDLADSGWTINNGPTETTVEPLNTPGPNDVGAFTGADDKPSIFEDWTPQWDSKRSDWGIASGTTFQGERALAFENDEGDRGRYAISCDTLEEPSDSELLDRFHVPAFADDDQLGLHARTYLRSSGSAGSENGYWVEIENRKETFRLGKYSNGDAVTLGRFGTPRDDTVYYRRFRANGDEIKARVWPISESEPSEWDIEMTDSEHTEGWSGLGSYSSELVETDVFSVATGGDSASFADAPSSPTVSWVNPTNGETVSGTITVQIEATDPVDGDGSLDVAYRLGGGSWSSASYNTDTGHYEDTWDAASSGEGDYTLEARATNSEGTTADAAIDITVEKSFSIATATARDVSNPSATLVGELTSLNGISSVSCGFEWRESGSINWNTTERQTVSSVGEFSDGISGLDGETEYEFRAVAYEPERLNAQTSAFYVDSAPDEEFEPIIEQFDIQDRSNPVWTRFDVDWTVSHDGGELDTVVTKLRYEGSTVDAESTSITGETASYSHLMRVRGPVDEIVLSVNDTENRVTTERKSL